MPITSQRNAEDERAALFPPELLPLFGDAFVLSCDLLEEYVARLKEIGAVYREVMGRHYPAMSAVQVADLIEDEAKVEIEVTAIIPS